MLWGKWLKLFPRAISKTVSFPKMKSTGTCSFQVTAMIEMSCAGHATTIPLTLTVPTFSEIAPEPLGILNCRFMTFSLKSYGYIVRCYMKISMRMSSKICYNCIYSCTSRNVNTGLDFFLPKWEFWIDIKLLLYVSQSNMMYSRTKEYIRNKTIDIIRNKKQYN